jgi:NAD(P)-dependent dehydrogenase (short-subunit alcohol dehydrogenase family)
MIHLNNKTILVTGASSGIGRATAILCDKLGAKVILSSRNVDDLKKVALQFKNKPLCIAADLSIESEVEKLVKQIPNIDGLAHCAGIVRPVPIKFTKQKHINELFDINFSSSVLLSSNLLSQKKINNLASVVFISSISVNHPYTGGAIYISSKAALEAFSKNFALEVMSKKIRSNVVSPALVKTKIWETISEAFTDAETTEIENKYPLGLGEAEDVANAIVFLLSDLSKWITGSSLNMDGGLLLNNEK